MLVSSLTSAMNSLADGKLSYLPARTALSSLDELAGLSTQDSIFLWKLASNPSVLARQLMLANIRQLNPEHHNKL